MSRGANSNVLVRSYTLFDLVANETLRANLRDNIQGSTSDRVLYDHVTNRYSSLQIVTEAMASVGAQAMASPVGADNSLLPRLFNTPMALGLPGSGSSSPFDIAVFMLEQANEANKASEELLTVVASKNKKFRNKEKEFRDKEKKFRDKENEFRDKERELKNKIEELKVKSNSQESENSDLEDENIKLELQNEELTEKLNVVSVENDGLQTKINGLESEYNSLKNSWSVKIKPAVAFSFGATSAAFLHNPNGYIQWGKIWAEYIREKVVQCAGSIDQELCQNPYYRRLRDGSNTPSQ